MSKKTQVYIYCDGGFGNRLLGLISGMALAQSIDRDPLIIWPVNSWCSIHFHEVFETTLTLKETASVDDLVSGSGLMRVLHENFFSDELFWVKSKRPLFLLKALRYILGPGIFFTTNRLERYARNPSNIKTLAGRLKFLAHYESKANEVIGRSVAVGGNYHALHIRQTDFPDALPIENYLEIVRLHQDKLFFICSDDERVELSFSIFKNVFFHQKSAYVNKLQDGDWNSVVVDSRGNEFPFNVSRSCQSVKDAIVDLIILSRGNLDLNPTTNSKFLDSARLLSVSPLLSKDV